MRRDGVCIMGDRTSRRGEGGSHLLMENPVMVSIRHLYMKREHHSLRRRIGGNGRRRRIGISVLQVMR
jgi:hypothetical protein